MGGVCLWQRQYFSNNATWHHDCNTCTCTNSVVKCTRVWCGLGNCLGHPNLTLDSIMCQANQVCVPSPGEACLTPECLPWGECRSLESGKRVGPPLLPAPPSCWPNQAVLSNTCARLTLLLDRSQLPRGVTTEGLCLGLRRLLAWHQAATQSYDQLVLLCDLKQGFNDTLEVTMSSLSMSLEAENRAVTNGIRVLGDLISRKQTNLSALTSIMEVKVETALVSEDKQGNLLKIYYKNIMHELDSFIQCTMKPFIEKSSKVFIRRKKINTRQFLTSLFFLLVISNKHLLQNTGNLYEK